MKIKMLGLAVLSCIGMSQVVAAQEYDNRWYFTGTLGYLWADDNRIPNLNDLLGTTDINSSFNSDYMWGAGIGKRITPNFALDLEYTESSPDFSYTDGVDTLNGKIDISTIELIARWHFGNEFYFAGGLGVESDDYNVGGSLDDDSGYVVRLGLGFESDRRKRWDYRFEAGMRYSDAGDFGQSPVFCDFNECGTVSLDFSGNTDFYATASLVLKLGDLPLPVVAAPAPTCDTLDSDNDGVNDCNDKCPGSTAGQTIGADGCPVKLTIDLKGVNFDFDKDTLRPDSIVILDEAVAVLAKYPELKVAVDGYTDQCGKDTYNQQLSQKRAAVVFKYLTDKGIAADRLSGPTGYGESNPLVDSGQAYPGCKNETNRRTELNVQN
ncbi:MAG: OmpA family protein [Arenimonas sp.]|nr:OmpA family protein [Arenimonas sp.]